MNLSSRERPGSARFRESTLLSAEEEEKLEAVRGFMSAIPFNRDLGIRVVELAVGRALLQVPYREGLIGDMHRPALHGGVISALVDTAGGAAVFTAIGKGGPLFYDRPTGGLSAPRSA